MSAPSFLLSTVLLLSLLGLVSCNFSQGSKSERKGIATEDTSLVARLEAGLSASGIPYKVSKTKDGLVSVTWKSDHDEIAQSILRSVEGRAREGPSSLCFFESDRLNELTSKLQRHSIPFELTKPNPGEWCVFWESEYDEKVAAVDPNWRSILDLEKEE